MLFEPERHESLSASSWDVDAARRAVRGIALDAERAFHPDTLWPSHPLDDEDASVRTGVYWGAAGVAWGLAELRRRDAVDLTTDFAAEAKRFVDIYEATPELGERTASFWLGEVGVRLVAGDDGDRVHELIAGNVENESLEFLWGAAGTMLPALFLFERTGETRWRALYRQNAAFLLNTLRHHADFDVWLWTQSLYGEVVRLLGAGHGFAGNMFPLLRGWELLDDEERELVVDRSVNTLRRTALFEGDLVNWAPHVGTPRRGREANLVQWCHGAPGMILALARLPRDDEVDALFAAAGELIWRAGPLVKGSTLCHGTAGNGYAFLALHARTGDEVWLHRARRFAMHALTQTHAVSAHYGRGRYSLWTGDVGVALFLQDCIDGGGELPALAYL